MALSCWQASDVVVACVMECACLRAETNGACMQVSDVDVAGEPEARRIARARRLAEQKRKIAEQVAAQQAAEAEKEAAKEQRGSIRDDLKPRIEQWQAGKKVVTFCPNIHCNHNPPPPLSPMPLRDEQRH